LLGASVMAGVRVAVAVWGERVSPLLDVSRRALLLDFDNGQVVSKRELALPDGRAEAKLEALHDQGVTTLLCGAVSQELAARARALGLELVAFLAGDVEAVVAAYLAGQLPNDELVMPGCRARRRQGQRWKYWDGSGTEPERSETMPNRDGTGPQGKRPAGGGGRGPCGGRGRGQGRGQGRGRGGPAPQPGKDAPDSPPAGEDEQK
jgi:predicted Fe-Mo cluster-binding NifX family protein